MKKKWKLALIVFVLLSLLLQTYPAAHAEEAGTVSTDVAAAPDTTNTTDVPNTPNVPNTEDAGVDESAGKTAESVIGGVTSDYEKFFDFDTARVLQGIYADTKQYINIPAYWETKYLYAALQFQVSEIITEAVPAYITVNLNSEPVYSQKVYYQNGQNQIIYVRLPADKLKIGYNLVSIVANVRVSDGFEGCSDEYGWANWIRFDESSYLCAGYNTVSARQQISDYPYPFVSTVNPKGEGTAVMVSDAAANEEIAAGLYLYAALSTETEKENRLFFGKYADGIKTKPDRQIVISTQENLPDAFAGYAKEDLSGRAMVRFLGDGNGETLLITAKDGKNLMEAVNMLLDDERASQEKSSAAYPAEGSSAAVAERKRLNQLIADSYTLKDILGGGLIFVGPFHKEDRIYLPFDNDYILSAEGKLTLRFRYSENLNFDRSLFTVFWGDIPIASKKLTAERAGGDELIITMPADVVGSTSKSIKVTFDLEIRDLLCSLRQDQMPWAYIAEDSTLYLPSQTNLNPSFGYIPSPFQSKGKFSDTLVVVSDEVTRSELGMLGKAAAIYGNGVGPYGELNVIRASEFDAETTDSHILTAGTYQSNAFLRSINSLLPFAYNADGASFRSNSTLVLSGHFSKDVAAMQLLQCPFAEGRSLLALCATSDKTAANLTEYLSLKRSQLSEDCVLVDSDLDSRAFRFNEEKDEEVKPSITEFIAEHKTSALFVLLSAAAFMMLLTASVIILIRARRHSSGK